MVDTHGEKYLRSIGGLPGVAGVLVSNETGLVFTSNRTEKTVGIFHQGQEDKVDKIDVDGHPNGLAYDESRQYLVAANVLRPDMSPPVNVSLVDTERMRLSRNIPVPGSTRWTVFDRETGHFYVNISKPAEIIAINSLKPEKIARTYPIPATGPHGLDIDPENQVLFCACDEAKLVKLEIASGHVKSTVNLTGPPDVIFYNAKLRHLYVAIGQPGVIDVFDTDTMEKLETVKTELGSHTIAYDTSSNKVYAFLPTSCQASIFLDEPE